MVTQYLDGLEVQLRKPFDLSFTNKYGKVFKVFDKQGSGALCFGTEKAGKRYFLKFAGAETVKSDGKLNIEDAISILKYSVLKYKDLKHPLLVNQIGAEGSAELAGFGSANPITTENYTTGSFTSFDGRAQAILRSGIVPGKAVLKVVSELGEAVASIDVV